MQRDTVRTHIIAGLKHAVVTVLTAFLTGFALLLALLSIFHGAESVIHTMIDHPRTAGLPVLALLALNAALLYHGLKDVIGSALWGREKPRGAGF